ncbi:MULTISPECIES: SDR family oxidoreductase [Streptomyces]|uniref:SDR family oxidoreductase n=1 Tax=Streptomyces spinosisporus TaxID=2927582 RepID=A0ABS9XQ46_9ACTN|nr:MULTISPECIES: SDR family oxidoreductase [Streptomyces]MCI3244193.1 SDR family oxidoreductase [Streptomyces spinosisporus]WUB41766.1 SDR family oxidoreductase [Streptomyces sp. NBC_00588]
MQDQGQDQFGAPPVISSEPAPPLSQQKQNPPGLESDMDPRPRYRAERYRAAGKLTGKVALITGGDSGIGRAVALLYAREGADVAVVYLPGEQSDAEETRQAVEEQGRRCLLLPGDLCEAAFCREVVERTVEQLGALNILVSNAAYLNSKLRLEQLTAEDWDLTFKTNAYAYFHLVMAALPHLDEGDAIIATATEEALKGSTTMIDYAASKAALVAFTKSIAPHLAERGVRANVVAPGPTWTVLNAADQHMPPEDLAQVGSETPIGRPAQPEEIAPAYVFLASDADSSFITGEVLAVTGGETDTR